MIKLTNDVGGKAIWINADRVIAVADTFGNTTITTTNGVFEVKETGTKVVVLIRDWHAF